MDYKSKSTEELESICRADAEAAHGMEWDELAPILMELARRRREADPNAKTPEEAWEEFIQHYLPDSQEELIDPATGVFLTPSWHGERCAGVHWCCDECDWLLGCWPDWKEHDAPDGFDDFIKRAVTEYCNALASFPHDTCTHEFSPEFEAKMAAILGK